MFARSLTKEKVLKKTKLFQWFSVLAIIFAGVFPVVMKMQSEQQGATMKKPHGVFAAAVNCMDGRVQDAVKNYLKENYGVDFVDMITEPGPNRILAENTDIFMVKNIKKRVGISVKHHGAKIIAIVGHYDCAGNPIGKEEQAKHLQKAKKTIESFGFNAKIIILWVDEERRRAVEIE